MEKYYTSQLVKRLTLKSSFSKSDIKTIVDQLLYEVHDTLAEGNEVVLARIGRLTPKQTNLKNGRLRVRFRPSVQLIEDLNEDNNQEEK